jgi:hypothetical protein
LASTGLPFIMFAMRSVQSTTFSVSRRTFLRQWVPRALACVLGAGCGVVIAIDDMQLDVERIDGDGWMAEGVQLQFNLPNERGAAQARIDRLKLNGRAETLRNVRVDCPAIDLSATVIACSDARISAQLPAVGPTTLRGRVSYQRASGALDLDVRSAQLLGGSARIKGSIRSESWHAQVHAERLDLEQALKVASELKLPVPAITGTGRVSMDVDVTGAPGPIRADISVDVQELTVNNESGTLASDKWAFEAHAALRTEKGGWNFKVQLDSSHGQAYAQPLFVDFGVHAASLRTDGHFEADGAIALHRFEIDHNDVLSAQGSARVDPKQEQPLRDLTLTLGGLQFPGAFESYLQPFLLDTDFKSMQTSGRVSGDVSLVDGAPTRVHLALDDVTFDDGTRKFALEGLSGEVSWRDGTDVDEDAVLRSGAQRSVLRWKGGSVLNLGLGPSVLQFTALGRQFRLLEAARIPVLDGALDLESLRIRNVGMPSVAFMVDATVQPISVAELCKAFGWPQFGGSIGGAVSKLRLRDGVVTLGTTLQAQVFDGRIAITDLRLEDTFGKWPRFYSSIALENLDLELVTRAFSFGRITGRLSGSIADLQLFNWQPIAFDANLYTPPDDRSKHRISQRAVENIGSIGGGGAGITQALSSGFLRFFDDFRYERLGLSCRLENEICYMNGVAPAPNGGYYLVKGSGLPRIDVIGGARRVDWPRLVQQLIAISESEGPVVQ